MHIKKWKVTVRDFHAGDIILSEKFYFKCLAKNRFKVIGKKYNSKRYVTTLQENN